MKIFEVKEKGNEGFKRELKDLEVYIEFFEAMDRFEPLGKILQARFVQVKHVKVNFKFF